MLERWSGVGSSIVRRRCWLAVAVVITVLHSVLLRWYQCVCVCRLDAMMLHGCARGVRHRWVRSSSQRLRWSSSWSCVCATALDACRLARHRGSLLWPLEVSALRRARSGGFVFATLLDGASGRRAVVAHLGDALLHGLIHGVRRRREHFAARQLALAAGRVCCQRLQPVAISLAMLHFAAHHRFGTSGNDELLHVHGRAHGVRRQSALLLAQHLALASGIVCRFRVHLVAFSVVVLHFATHSRFGAAGSEELRPWPPGRRSSLAGSLCGSAPCP